jgi:hypothetical protein
LRLSGPNTRLDEPALREVRVRATRSASVAASPAARVLALQSAIGNRGLVHLLQRHKSHKNWSLAVADKERTEIDLTARPWHTTREVKAKGTGKRAGKKQQAKAKAEAAANEKAGEKKKTEFVGSTLHHMISKAVLDLIERDLQQGLASRDTDVSAAAGRFNAQLTKAARASGITEGDRAKQLWNLFVNLEAGPTDVVGDPGEGFDASYQMISEKDGSRRFVETAVSTELRTLEQAYRTGRRTAGRDGTLGAASWDAMAEALKRAKKQAKEAGTLANIRVDKDQWMPFTATDDNGVSKTRWTRSGARRYPGVQLGRPLFPAAPVAPAQVAAIPAVTAAFDISNDADNDMRPSRAYLSVGIPAPVIGHICERHTYRHFTGVPSDMKATNTFFRDAALDAAGVRALLAQALPDIVTAVGRHIEDAALGIEDYDELLEDEDLSLAGIPTSRGELYVKLSVSHDDTGQRNPLLAQPNQPPAGGQRPSHGWIMTLKTAAPDGPDADAYTRDELVALSS